MLALCIGWVAIYGILEVGWTKRGQSVETMGWESEKMLYILVSSF